ncbi:MAG TPA: DUF5615 family PIN-like protein [Actinomycetota bacterium]|nr:DUF5615 family PIN-like protein [Actinomycetota bacterium]
MRFLLDENFPLQLHRQLKARGIECEHIVALGQRQMTDSQILERVNSEADLVLLTQDREFETMPIRLGKVIISRLPQSLPTQRRVEVWLQAVEEFVSSAPQGTLFELGRDGEVSRLPE